LRDAPLHYPITAEYPIVLAREHAAGSWVVREKRGGPIVAHANLWERTWTNGSSQFRIAFVGNVATDPDHQGKGIMRKLLVHLEQTAMAAQIRALTLWSDLESFYQNCGYSSHGRENRYFLHWDELSKLNERPGVSARAMSSTEIDAMNVGPHANLLTSLLKHRYPTNWRVERTDAEFARLLKIPDCMLYLIERNRQLCGYCILGKGADMQGVIHEWGCEDPAVLLCAMRAILDRRGWTDIILLAPATLTPAHHESIKPHARRIETHPMAWAKLLDANSSETFAAIGREGFIWGLDSI